MTWRLVNADACPALEARTAIDATMGTGTSDRPGARNVNAIIWAAEDGKNWGQKLEERLFIRL